MKVGIIGAGMIGKLVINMLKSYDLEVLVFDPFLPDDTARELGVKKVDLDTLFSYEFIHERLGQTLDSLGQELVQALARVVLLHGKNAHGNLQRGRI